ncbi:MAG: 1-acyl-sn-glycerol-3-phosphate acyltransferase [Bacteroidetes bacterium]|nr:1-acyl-sn-glycerol-3-phosphate acyltransferase [Bacteroidota bacterium]
MNTIPHGTVFALQDNYHTPDTRRRSFLPATFSFYIGMISVVFRAAHAAKRGRYDGSHWVNSSIDIINALERAGCTLHIEGMQHIRALKGPAVFVANHMSTLETFVLPSLIHPVKPCTFVIKPGLMDYPVFGHIMRGRNPVVVSRNNPRQDLVTVMEEGAHRLQHGTSIVLFPQTTRSDDFDPAAFNSLGVKLAKKAGVPLLPVALKTDAWMNGRMIKDFGPVDVRRPIHFRFFPPIAIEGSGRDVHPAVTSLIMEQLALWKAD